MAEGEVKLSVEDAIATITLERVAKANALNLAMLKGLEQRLEEAESIRELRVLLITGTGKAFCAGGDIKSWSAMKPEAFVYDWVKVGNRVLDRLARLNMPTIAVLNGHALGGGFELAAACDLRIAEEPISIGLPETSIGVVPGWSGTQRTVRKFGGAIVRRMALGGDVLGSGEALRLGLVDRVVPEGTGLKAAKAWAISISARSPQATRIAKLMISAAEGEDPAGSVDALASGFVAAREDLAEGISAYLAKRPADFPGKG